MKSPNKDETAVCGCNPAVSVLVVVLSRKVYFSRSMISLACSLLSTLRTARALNDPYGSNELNLLLTDRYSAGVLDMGGNCQHKG